MGTFKSVSDTTLLREIFSKVLDSREPHSAQAATTGHKNHEFCVDLTTRLVDDFLARQGKPYVGTLTRDTYDQFSFVEAARTSSSPRRNPHVFRGRYINVTRSESGAYRPVFRPMPQVACHAEVEEYAWNVFCELMTAFEGLLPENVKHKSLNHKGIEK